MKSLDTGATNRLIVEARTKALDFISELDEVWKKIEESQKQDQEKWYDSKDTLTLTCGEDLGFKDVLEVQANYESWEYSKKNNIKDLLYIDITEDQGDNSGTSLDIEDMKKLRDYLTHKIEYLEADE